MLKKGDFVIIACVAAAILLSCGVFFIPRGTGDTVVIKKDNEVLYRLPISEDATLRLDGNTVEIKDGKVRMKWADCDNQLCVSQGEISSAGETIICLPHKVSVTITEEQQNG